MLRISRRLGFTRLEYQLTTQRHSGRHMTTLVLLIFLNPHSTRPSNMCPTTLHVLSGQPHRLTCSVLIEICNHGYHM